METWLTFLKNQPEQVLLESPEALASIFTLDLRNPQVASIQSSVSQFSEQSIAAEVDKARLLDDEWPGLVALARSYLIWCAFVDPQAPQSCFARYAAVYLSLQQAYANFRGSCLNLVVRRTTTEIFRLFGNSGKLHQEWIASGLLKLFNAVRSERGEAPSKNAPLKRENAVFYANMISRAYFKSGQFLSAGNVFNNMHSVGVAMSNFPKSEQVEYRFWLGRYLLYRNDIDAAFIHLNWAYDNCLPNTYQASLILDWLVVPSILVGRLPNLSAIGPLISEGETRAAVQTLVFTLKSGVFPPNYTSLVTDNPWVAARHLRPVIDTHIPLLVHRRGLQRMIKLSGTDKLPLRFARAAFHMDPASDPDLLITESICETLISRGMVKGNVLPVSKTLVLKSHGSVPPLLEVNQVLTRNLPDREQWLQR